MRRGGLPAAWPARGGPDEGLRWARTAVEQSRALEFDWAARDRTDFEGILHAIAGDAETAQARYAEALEIQRAARRLRRSRDVAGRTRAAGRRPAAICRLRSTSTAARSAAFEAVGDRAEEARILAEIAWAHIRRRRPRAARRHFFEAVQAHTDVASVRGVGHALIGLAAAEAIDTVPTARCRSPPPPRCMPRRRASSSSTQTRRRGASSSTGLVPRSRPMTSHVDGRRPTADDRAGPDPAGRIVGGCLGPSPPTAGRFRSSRPGCCRSKVPIWPRTVSSPASSRRRSTSCFCAATAALVLVDAGSGPFVAVWPWSDRRAGDSTRGRRGEAGPDRRHAFRLRPRRRPRGQGRARRAAAGFPRRARDRAGGCGRRGAT